MSVIRRLLHLIDWLIDRLIILYRSVSLDDRVAEVLTWFDVEPKDFPNLGALYFEEPDTIAGLKGPFHSDVSQRSNICQCLFSSLNTDSCNVNKMHQNVRKY